MIIPLNITINKRYFLNIKINLFENINNSNIILKEYYLKYLILFIILKYLFLYTNSLNAQCNGFEELCSKSYDNIAFLTSHNAYASSEDGFFLPNQNLNIPNQLNMGVRAFMLDVYDVNGELFLYHTLTELGTIKLSIVLNQFNDFLLNNPNEIITLIFEDYTTSQSLSLAFENSNLTSYLFEYSDSLSWPTLQEMIYSNKRLVILTDNDDDNSPSSHHYVWDLAVETHFDNTSYNDFSCDFNRGNEQNSLFIFNHFLNNYFLYLIDSESYLAEIEFINSSNFLENRIAECIEQNNKFPNFIAIDFVDNGEALEVVNNLNELTISKINEINLSHLIFPNPSTGKLIIQSINLDEQLTNISVFNILGFDVSNSVIISEYNSIINLDLNLLKNGVYLLKVNQNSYTIIKK